MRYSAEGDTLFHCPPLSLQMTAPLCREHCHHREGSVSLPLLDTLSPPPSMAELRERAMFVVCYRKHSRSKSAVTGGEAPTSFERMRDIT